MNLRDELITALINAKIPSPRLEADIIIKNVAPEYPNINQEQEKAIIKCMERRIKHEPLDKIIGKREFYKSTFIVDNNVLSPRADTEILVESALDFIPKDSDFSVLDLGTGSGCIILSLLQERANIKATAVDISPDALNIAQKNAINLGQDKRLEFINKSWTENDFITSEFDMIVSNPPYIPSADISSLEIEVKSYDPIKALDGGMDGLDCYRQIAKVAPLLLKDNGYILLEVGYNQAEMVANIFIEQKLTLVKIVQDLSGINRCVILKK